MRIYGSAGALVTADRGIDLPTAPVRYRDHLADVESKWAFRSPIPPPAPAAPPGRPAGRRRSTERGTRASSTRADSTPQSDAVDPAEAGAGSLQLARPTGRRATSPRPAAPPAVRPQHSARPAARRPGERPAAATDGRVRADGATTPPSQRHTQQAARGAVLVEQLATRWAAGQSRAQIAADLQISVTTVQRLRRAHGVAPRRTPLDRAEVARLYAVHRSIERVAALLGTGPAAVRYQLARAGVVVRAPGDNGRRRSAADRAAALAAYQAGQPVADIYSQYGISETTLARWRHEAGIPARGQRGTS